MARDKFDVQAAAKKFISNVDVKSRENKELVDKNALSTNKKKKKLVQRGYYLTNDLYKKIKMRAVEQDKDTSSIVREAIEEYFEKHK